MEKPDEDRENRSYIYILFLFAIGMEAILSIYLYTYISNRIGVIEVEKQILK